MSERKIAALNALALARQAEFTDASQAVYLTVLADMSDTQVAQACAAFAREPRAAYQTAMPSAGDIRQRCLGPVIDPEKLAHVAWAQLERECRRIGAYRPVEFVDPAFGHTVRQVFGSWAAACSFDLDSPAWAIRRQTFLAVFPVMVAREDLEPVQLAGLHRHAPMATVGHLIGLPEPTQIEATPNRGRDVLAEVKRRFLESRQ